MQPKFNKLITLLLLLGTFAFIMETEQRLKSFARTNLSGWASLLPQEDELQTKKSINPYTQESSLTTVSLLDSIRKANIKNN